MAGRDQLEAAVQAFEERDVEHSDITELPPYGIGAAIQGPDGAALELTTPL